MTELLLLRTFLRGLFSGCLIRIGGDFAFNFRDFFRSIRAFRFRDFHIFEQNLHDFVDVLVRVNLEAFLCRFREFRHILLVAFGQAERLYASGKCGKRFLVQTANREA